MKIINIISVSAIVVLALVPLTAEAKKRHSTAHRVGDSASYLDVIKICRQKYGNGYDVEALKKGGHWTCRYRIN